MTTAQMIFSSVQLSREEQTGFARTFAEIAWLPEQAEALAETSSPQDAVYHPLRPR
jgi:hypothetical protein